MPQSLHDRLVELNKRDYRGDWLLLCHHAHADDPDVPPENAARRFLRSYRRKHVMDPMASVETDWLCWSCIQHFVDVYGNRMVGRIKGTLDMKPLDPALITTETLLFYPDQLELEDGELIIENVRVEPAPGEQLTDGQWTTYDEAAVRLGISSDAVRRRAARGRWARTLGNDGLARIQVPDDVSAPRGGNVGGDTAPLVSALEGHIATLKTELASEKERSERAAAELKTTAPPPSPPAGATAPPPSPPAAAPAPSLSSPADATALPPSPPAAATEPLPNPSGAPIRKKGRDWIPGAFERRRKELSGLLITQAGDALAEESKTASDCRKPLTKGYCTNELRKLGIWELQPRYSPKQRPSR
jgi:hypothetical protein